MKEHNPEFDKTPEFRNETNHPADQTHADQDQFAIDAYGIKTKFTLGDPDEEESTNVPSMRPWRDVWRDCGGLLQQLVVSLVELPLVVLQQGTRIVRNVGRSSKGVADITQRLAGGRSRVDHSEDEKIAEAAERQSLPDPDEARRQSKNVIDSLQFQLEALQSRGIPARIVEAQPGLYVILLVPEENQSVALNRVQQQLPRLAEPERSPSTPEELAAMQTPVLNVGFSSRVLKCLAQLKVTTVGQLSNCTPIDLMSSHGFGVASLNEVRAKLAVLALSLKDE